MAKQKQTRKTHVTFSLNRQEETMRWNSKNCGKKSHSDFFEKARKIRAFNLAKKGWAGIVVPSPGTYKLIPKRFELFIHPDELSYLERRRKTREDAEGKLFLFPRDVTGSGGLRKLLLCRYIEMMLQKSTCRNFPTRRGICFNNNGGIFCFA